MSKIIQVTITSSLYKTLGDYLKDHRSPAFPSILKLNQSQDSDKFDWNNYAREFLAYKNTTDYKISNISKKLNNSDEKDNEVKYGVESEVSIESNYYRIRDAFKNYPNKISEFDNYSYQRNFLDIPLKPGIVLSIPIEKVSREALLSKGIEVVSNNEPAFKAKALISLESDRGYRKILQQDNKTIEFGDIKAQFPNITVWVWCRALSDNSSTTDYELDGQIFNITPFIKSISTSQTKASGGNFTLNLAPVGAVRDKETGKWILKHESMLYNYDSDELIVKHDTHTLDQVTNQSKLIRNQNLFHNIVQSNDLVFIRFETLEKELNDRKRDSDQFIIDKKELPNKIYDMIGLVDRNVLNENYEMNDSQIIVTGRDLSKLFIEDGSYFYSMEQKEGVFYLQGGATAKNQHTQRIINTNAHLFLGLYYNNTIEDILGFIIQQLSVITVVPDNLFDAYANYKGKEMSDKNDKIPLEIRKEVDKRNLRYGDAIQDSKFNTKEWKSDLEKIKTNLEEKKRQTINQIIKFRQEEFKTYPKELIRDIDTNKICEGIFESLKKFVKHTLTNKTDRGDNIAKINISNNSKNFQGWRQNWFESNFIDEDQFPHDFMKLSPNDPNSLLFNFVDLYSVSFSVERMPFMQGVYDYILLEKQYKEKNALDNPDQTAGGIWQIVKLVIDKKVSKRMLIDSSISSASGSIMNYLKKVAQEPFVELFADTYGDMFYITVRQPPTDKVGMLSYITGNYQDEENINESDDELNVPAIVELEDIDIASQDLVFDESNIYSWYHFTPKGAFIANSTQFSTTFLPAIYFEQYAKIWGSKSLDFTHNYANYYMQYKVDSVSKDSSKLQMQSFIDMKYVIESNQYMPFARKGTITIKGGDRRIKVGNPIRLLSTGEIFWVDSVSNTFSLDNNIERATTIHVSRGLNEAFIKGVKGSELNAIFKNDGYKFTDDKVFSYFNIINTELNLKTTQKYQPTKQIEKRVPIKNKNKTSVKDYKDSKVYKNDAEYFKSKVFQPTKEQILIPSLQKYARENSNYGKLLGGLVLDEYKRESSDVIDNFNKGYYDEVLTKSEALQLDKKLAELRTDVQIIFKIFINKLLSIGWKVEITSAYRTYEEQKRIWDKEQAKKARGETFAKVARPGESPHNRGIAIDLNLISMRKIGNINKGVKLLLPHSGGEPARKKWQKSWIDAGIPNLAKSLGIMWGGYYDGYCDNVHFQVPSDFNKGNEGTIPYDTDFETIYETVNDGPPMDIFDPMTVFSDFKVDDEIFNFFLRKQQMGIIVKGSGSMPNSIDNELLFQELNKNKGNSTLNQKGLVG